MAIIKSIYISHRLNFSSCIDNPLVLYVCIYFTDILEGKRLYLLKINIQYTIHFNIITQNIQTNMKL